MDISMTLAYFMYILFILIPWILIAVLLRRLRGITRAHNILRTKLDAWLDYWEEQTDGE